MGISRIPHHDILHAGPCPRGRGQEKAQGVSVDGVGCEEGAREKMGLGIPRKSLRQMLCLLVYGMRLSSYSRPILHAVTRHGGTDYNLAIATRK